MASIKDVAKRAGVGVGTVSRVLTNSGYVAAKTRQRVEKAMAELEYYPNEMARNLFHNRTNIIGLIIPDLAHPFFGMTARHIEMELYRRGFKMLVCNTIQESSRESEFLDMLRCHMMDGIIMGAHTIEVVEYEKVHAPVVGFDRFLGEGIPCISSDHEQGGIIAARRMLADNRKNIIQLVGQQNVKSPSLDRHESFASVCREEGALVRNIIMPWNDFDFHSYRYLAEDIYTEYPEVDGLFAADLPARACLGVYLRHGRLIPHDMSIIGYDGSLASDISPFRITTVAQQIPLIAKRLVHRILLLIEDSTESGQEAPLAVLLREGDTTLPSAITASLEQGD